jgi:hypothetical protein
MIAISYRREDSLPVAGRLYDRLEQRFGKNNVFMDFDSIRPGFDFRDQIKETIERSKVVIAVIGSNWLGEQSDGSRRIDDPADFVRLEVAYALQRGIPVIPVLINNAPMPKPEAFPSDIAALAFRHALPLDIGLDFRQHVDRLIVAVQGASTPDKAGEPRNSRRFRQRVIRVSAGALLIAGIAAVSIIRVTKNKPEDTGHEKRLPKTTVPPMLVESQTQGSTSSAMPPFAQPAVASMPQPQPSNTPFGEHKLNDLSSSPPYTPIPVGYSVLKFTVSPSGRYGVIAPDLDHFIEGAFKHQLVDLQTGRSLGLIQADAGLADPKAQMGHGGINPARWSKDETALLWEVEGRWSPRALVIAKIAEDSSSIKWQVNILKIVQQEMLLRTKRASPERYRQAVEWNKGSGSAFPDGFVVNVRALTATADEPITFPINIHAGLTSNPKGIEKSRGSVDLNSELEGFIDSNGNFTVKKFGLSKKTGNEIALATGAPTPSAVRSRIPDSFVGTWQGTIGGEIRSSGQVMQISNEQGIVIDQFGRSAMFLGQEPPGDLQKLFDVSPRWRQVTSQRLRQEFSGQIATLTISQDGRSAEYECKASDGGSESHGILHRLER